MVLRTARRVFAGLLLALADMILASASMFFAYKVRFEGDDLFSWPLVTNPGLLRPYLSLIVIAPVVRVACMFVFNVYNTRRRARRGPADIFVLIQAVSVGSLILVVVAFAYRGVFEYREFSYSRFVLLLDWLLNMIWVAALHNFVNIIREELFRRGIGTRRLAIQGTGAVAKRLAREIAAIPETGYRVVGFVADQYDGANVDCGGVSYPYLGSPQSIRDAINRTNLNEVVVTNTSKLGVDLLKFVETCHELDVVVKLVPDLHGILFRQSAIEDLGGQPVVQVNEIGITGAARVAKRIEDLILATVLLLVMWPVFLIAAILIRLESPGPVIFSQQRIGRNGRHFRIFKFRSMYEDAEQRRPELQPSNESDGVLFKMKNDPRVTRIGRFLRRTNIDELPNLLNVLAGNMSLVGPRPLPITDVPVPEAWEAARFTVLPGMTGMWQVHRIEHTAEEMLEWDVYYIENWSLWLDLKILWRTIYVVLTGKGAY